MKNLIRNRKWLMLSIVRIAELALKSALMSTYLIVTALRKDELKNGKESPKAQPFATLATCM